MGICIFKGEESLERICEKEPEFQVDENRSKKDCMAVWRVMEDGTESVKWPYTFYSTSAYIVIVARRGSGDVPILQKNKTSIEIAEMLFRAQFLCQHLKIIKKLMLNNKQYSLSIYSFFGDSSDDETLSRAQLTYYMEKLVNYLQLGVGCFCLSMLNDCQPVVLKNDLKQYIDFESEQFAEIHGHIFFKQQLLGNRPSIKQSIHDGMKCLVYQNFVHGGDNLPHIYIKEPRQKKDKRNKQKQLDESFPFVCQITQIHTKSNNKISAKLEGGNFDSSNHLFDEFVSHGQSEEIERIQEFLKGLYLATEKASKNYNLLNTNKIKLIVNCAAGSCKNWFMNDINYKWIDIPDPLQANSNEYNVQCLIYQVADIAGKCLAQPAGVLIHCSGYNPKIQFSGSRSAAILIGIIMSSLKLSYENSFAMVNNKWQIKLPQFMERQLKNLEKRKKQKPKGFHVYSICSYSKYYPRHLVAVYLCEIENTQNLQGIDEYEKSVFLCVGGSGNKIMFGRECEFKEQYEKYAKEHLRLLNKYEGVNNQCATQPIEKTFRRQAKIQIKQKIMHIDPKVANKNAGFLRNEEMVLKYPILRPVWQRKKDDGFYFTIKQKNQGAEVMMSKGMNWIGYESDKEQFFDRIINCYLGHVPHDKIFIIEAEQEKSIFDMSKID